MERSDLIFVGRILDNVHGFIYYTKAEEKIINTLLFKRLQAIKQLSIVNWVFPGSEHTRYIHSLGVMYIIDKMAIQLGLEPKDRKIVRLAGLLHDIGHYPLSHVCEFPYKKNITHFPDDSFCTDINNEVIKKIKNLKDNDTTEYMDASDGWHHEKIGAEIVKNNKEIRDIIIEECGTEAIDIICKMIIGSVESDNIDPLYVQMLHSELDADGIDYLMRDAMFSGTSFGAFELDQLIGCMEIGVYKDKKILCINPKGIAAADQYLINKFFLTHRLSLTNMLQLPNGWPSRLLTGCRGTVHFSLARTYLQIMRTQPLQEMSILLLQIIFSGRHFRIFWILH